MASQGELGPLTNACVPPVFMEADDRAFILCLTTLRWLGLSCTAVAKSPSGDFVGRDSVLSLLVNSTLVGIFLFIFFRIDLQAYEHTAEIYKTSPIVYPLYTKFLVTSIVVFILCGNVYNRRFPDILNHLRGVVRRVARDFGIRRRRRKGNGCRILLRILLYVTVVSVFKALVDYHLLVHYERRFRVVHYICSYYATLFTAHFVVTMNHLRETFAQVNLVFEKTVREVATVSGALRGGGSLGSRMAPFVELREVEDLVNGVFGKQVFLTQSLAFAGIIINSYYFITLNLYGTSYLWLNICILFGVSEAIIVALMNARAADLAAAEANRVNEIIFSFPGHLSNWQLFNQMRYFALFNYYNPVEFRAWVFCAINYEAFFKVLLTTCAITLILLQCDFIRVRLLE